VAHLLRNSASRGRWHFIKTLQFANFYTFLAFPHDRYLSEEKKQT